MNRQAARLPRPAGVAHQLWYDGSIFAISRITAEKSSSPWPTVLPPGPMRKNQSCRCADHSSVASEIRVHGCPLIITRICTSQAIISRYMRRNAESTVSPMVTRP